MRQESEVKESEESRPQREDGTMTVKRLALLLVLLSLFALSAVSAAGAAQPAPGWAVRSFATPTNIAPGTGGEFHLVVTNVGGQPSTGTVTVVDTLPVGATNAGGGGGGWGCVTEQVAGREIVTCTRAGSVPALTPAPVLTIAIQVPAVLAGSVVNQVEVSGGGAPFAATAETPIPISSELPAFSVVEGSFVASLLDSAGAPDTTAGDHPGAQFTSFALSSAEGKLLPPGSISGGPYPVQDEKQIVTELPAGLVGDALATPTCPLTDVTDLTESETQCPAATRIGTLALMNPPYSYETDLVVFNVTPEHGYAAEFAVFLPNPGRAAMLYARLVGSGADAHVQVTSAPQNSLAAAVGISVTFFGNPALQDGGATGSAAFFTNPSDCQATGFTSTVYVDSWQNPGTFNANGEPEGPAWKSASSTAPPVTGCEYLQFHPTFALSPTAFGPDQPSGVNASLRIPQNEDPTGLAAPPLKDATVTLPEGFDVNPSSATGLEACSNEQIDLALNAPGNCPLGSQIGEVTVHTPLLAEPLQGQVFLGTPECDPCGAQDAQDGKMIRAFIQVSSERYGVTLKVPGTVTLDPANGRVMATFDDSPQQPFSELQFKFKEGPRAPLSTPAACGSYETQASLTPWSAPYTPTVSSPSAFTISGCNGNPFSPAFTAFNASTQAGQYSPFTLSFSRGDSEQDFDALEATLPPGLLAKLAGVQRCGESELAAAKARRALRSGPLRSRPARGSSRTTRPAGCTSPARITAARSARRS
jgi:hypothetical protein